MPLASWPGDCCTATAAGRGRGLHTPSIPKQIRQSKYSRPRSLLESRTEPCCSQTARCLLIYPLISDTALKCLQSWLGNIWISPRTIKGKFWQQNCMDFFETCYKSLYWRLLETDWMATVCHCHISKHSEQLESWLQVTKKAEKCSAVNLVLSQHHALKPEAEGWYLEWSSQYQQTLKDHISGTPKCNFWKRYFSTAPVSVISLAKDCC